MIEVFNKKTAGIADGFNFYQVTFLISKIQLCRLNLAFGAAVSPVMLGALYQEEHHGNHHQGEHRGIGKPKDDGPGEWPPKHHVVASQKDVRVKIGDE